MKLELQRPLAGFWRAADNGLQARQPGSISPEESSRSENSRLSRSNMELQSVRMEIPGGANLILGQAHFIKTAEDLYEAVVNTVPGAKFAVAFNEASGPCLIRVEANDDELRSAAISNAQSVGAGHVFVL